MVVKRLTILLVALMVILNMPFLVPVTAAETGTVTAQLINNTAGGKSVADVELQLKTSVDGKETASAPGKTASDGKFTFNNLSIDPKNSYQVTFTYQEVEYTSDYVSFGASETSKRIEVKVYDATNSLEAIKVTQAHAIVSVGKGVLEVTEYFLFTNGSDKAYVGSGEITSTGKRRTLDFPIPGKVTDMEYGDGLMTCCVLPNQNGFVDTMPVLPGDREILYAYRTPYSGQRFDFKKMINYPVDEFSLLVKGEGIAVSSQQLVDQGPLNIEQHKYSYAVGTGLTPGTTLSATLSGLPASTNQKTFLIWVAGALVLLTAGSALAFRRSRSRAQAQPVRVESNVEQRQEKLLLEIAQLDDEFAAGRIAEPAYRNQRAMKKTQLVKLMSASRGASER